MRGQYLAAHWLQKSAAGTYDYDVKISTSNDSGKTWNTSFTPHRDSIAAEHGFVTMLHLQKDTFFAVWLDGRHTKSGHTDADDVHGHRGAMSLRCATFTIDNHLVNEWELDHQICDCCQTDAALTNDGIIVAYRDRSEYEVRDISIVRYVNGKWTTPRKVHDDHWKIAGCPVNGPAIAANGNQVAIAWYTAADETPKVNVAFSENAGKTFDQPIQIDDGTPLGRVDILWEKDRENVIVTWLEQTGQETAEIRMKRVSPNRDTSATFIITETSPSRSSGFPVLEQVDNQLLVAFTDVFAKDSTIVKTFSVELPK